METAKQNELFLGMHGLTKEQLEEHCKAMEALLSDPDKLNVQ